MRNTRITSTSARRLRVGIAAAASALAVCVLPAAALGATANDTTQFQVNAGTLNFQSAPNVADDLTAVALNGQAQTTNSTMSNYTVQDGTGAAAGWNLTVSGNTGAGLSPVFKQYCPPASAPCGSDPAGYVSASPATLPANSLTLSSAGGATFSGVNGTTGTAPTHQCGSGCFVDAPTASPVKVASAATNAGMGTWQATSFSASSLALSTPSSIKVLSNGEKYHVDLLWTLSSGP
jgi:hypothetical protein